jgi:hypothetical protein
MHFDSKKYSFQVISSNSILKEREWVKQNYMYFGNKDCIITILSCSEYASRNKFWMFSKNKRVCLSYLGNTLKNLTDLH